VRAPSRACAAAALRWQAANRLVFPFVRAGNGRLEAQCIDGTKRLCHIRGKMRKKVWVNTVRARAALTVRSAHAARGFRFRAAARLALKLLLRAARAARATSSWWACATSRTRRLTSS
jgi:hypothetical protein